MKAKAQWAENHGFTWFSVMDHLIQIGNVGAPDEPFMEGWTVLSGLAAVTTRIRLATLVSSVHYRNPALLAKIAAGVDQISRGRLTFGIGAGWFETEYRQYGWEFPPRPAVRIRQMEEAVRLIHSMWTEKRTTFQGKYFQAAGRHPGTQADPEAASADDDRRRRRAADAARGRPAGGCLQRRRHARHGPAQVRGAAPPLRGGGPELRRGRADQHHQLRHRARRGGAGRQAAASSPFRTNYYGVAGTVAQITDLVGRYRDAGVQLFISSAYKNDAETLELLAADVMPAFAR